MRKKKKGEMGARFFFSNIAFLPAKLGAKFEIVIVSPLLLYISF